MTLGDHHDWVRSAANQLKYGGDALWQAMCAEWAQVSAPVSEAKRVAQVIDDALDARRGYFARLHRAAAALRADSRRCSGVIFAARAAPPFNPPSRPSSTAAAFFVGCDSSSGGASPVAIRTTPTLGD